MSDTIESVKAEMAALLEKGGRKPVTFRGLWRILDGTHDELIKQLKVQRLRADALEARLAALEQAHNALESKALKGGATWVGETGEAIEFPAFALEVTGADFAEAVRRQGDARRAPR